MPHLLRICNGPAPCDYCRMMAGTRYEEGLEPLPSPYTPYGVPAHRSCTCQYIRWNLIETQTHQHLVTDKGDVIANIVLQSSRQRIITQSGDYLAWSSELLPVAFTPLVTDVPGYKDTLTLPAKDVGAPAAVFTPMTPVGSRRRAKTLKKERSWPIY